MTKLNPSTTSKRIPETLTTVRRARPRPDRPAPPAGAQPRGLPPRAGMITGIVVIALLCIVSLGLAFRSGAYSLADWVPFLIGVAALAVMVAISGPAVFSGRFQKILLALFALQAVWTASSIFWATSLGNTWEEINRTLLYAVGIGLVFAAVRWAGPTGLKTLAALVAAVIGVMALVIVIRLGVSDDPSGFFISGRLRYPITYYNALAALLMVGFWLALGMANGMRQTERRFPRWTQPLLLALGVFFAELALLPQSRGALWTFFLVVPFFVILSPHRFRALVDLGIVVLPVVLFWGRLNEVYVASMDKVPLGAAVGGALRAIGYSVLIVLGAWAVTWLVERFAGPLSRRVRLSIGIVLMVLAIAGVVGGLVYADAHTGGLGGYLDNRWAEFTGDQGPSADTTNRFAALGLSGRVEQWKVAAKAFEENPVLGIGAQNFELYYDQHRTIALDVRNPHSQPMQLLAELGFPGLVLWLAFVVLTLVWAVMLRFRAANRATQAVIAAMMTAVISWFIHSSADWLWQMSALTFPVMMLFGGLIGAGGRQERVPVTGAGAETGAEARAGAGAGTEAGAETRPGPEAISTKAVPGEATPGIPRARRHLRVSRSILTVLALLVLVSAALPYLCIRYCSFAAGSADLTTLTARAHTAEKLDPTSVLPFSVRATAHQAAAQAAPESSAERVEQFKLAAAAWVEASKQEPGSWLYFYLAAEAFVAARDAALSANASSAAQELEQSARFNLGEAKRLNPLSDQVASLEKAF